MKTLPLVMLRRKEMKARENKTGEELVEPLTHREHQILVLLAQGYSAPEIAQQLTLALSSVKWYVQQVYRKLGVNNKQRAIIRAGELGLLETHAHVPSVHFSSKHNLPSQLTSFIGREKEIETVKDLITSHGGGQLLTLTGAGGSGKTRLALQVAYATLNVFSDGVWFTDFAPLTDPTLVPQSLLTTLGLSEQAGRSTLAIVSDFLQPKQALLVLDNCEHLIQACAQLVETLLRACPTLQILATSREALGVPGERLYLVPTLTTPDPAQADLETLPQYEAVRLFVERAQTALPGFRLTNDNTLAVARVCHQLDGIPLALELAAARVKALRVEQIASRLEDRFELLTTGSRTAVPRHQTLQALIDWSHELLSEPERVLLRRLAVFAGGWTLEAAEAVCVGEGVEADAVLDLMTQLVNKSLILAEREQGQEARYRILETIREYANERLLEADEGEQLRNQHLDFFLQWTEGAELEVRGPHQLKWLNQLEVEHDNLRAALEWSLTQAEHGEASLQLAGALSMFWYRRGYISEGRAWLARALTNPTAPSAARAQALYAAGYLARLQGDTTTARALLEESVGLWRAIDPADRTGLALTLSALGDAMRRLGDPATARSLGSEASALAREQGERWDLAYSLSWLGVAIRDQEDFALARSVINESVAIWRDLGDRWGLRVATSNLGDVAMREGDYELARDHHAECVAISQQLGDKDGLAWDLLSLGMATINLGDRDQAKYFFEQSYGRSRESGDKFNLAVCLYYFGYLALFEGNIQQAKTFFEQELELARTTGPIWLGAQALSGLAGVSAANGQARRAARLLGAARTQLEAGASYTDAANALYERRAVDLIVAQIGEAAFAAARAEGRAMTFEQAADYALETEPSA
jgi:predicted ATPase/DNA-binding CsgD family transcriptional regulator